MNKKQFKELISEAITPVLRRIIRQELKKVLIENAVNNPAPVLRNTRKNPGTVEKEVVTETKSAFSMADIFSETEPFGSDDDGSVDSSLDQLNDGNLLSDKELVNETIDNTAGIGEKQKGVAKAMTKDYSELMKHLNDRRGASRRQSYR